VIVPAAGSTDVADGMTAATTATADITPTADIATTATAAAAATKRWSGKRRVRPASVASVRGDAAAGVAAAAQYQKEYYEAKLQMAQERHAVKMRILALKERRLLNKNEEE